MNKNLNMLNQMLKLSRIIKDTKEARNRLEIVAKQTAYFIIVDEPSNFLEIQTKASVLNCLYVEQYLHLSVSNLCACLDGFNQKIMEPVNYISSADIRSGSVEIYSNNKIVASIKLKTGEITLGDPEQEIAVEDKCPAVKS